MRVARETTRAFLIFGVLTVALLAIGGELTFRQLSLNMLDDRLDLGRNTALQIAGQIAEIGLAGDVIDYAELRANDSLVTQVIRSRLDRWAFVRSVEVRDRFGVRLTLISREDIETHLPGTQLPRDWPRLDEIIEVPLFQGGVRPEGQVRLHVSPAALRTELLTLRRSIRVKIVIAVASAVGVLALGLLYVLYLIRKNQRLEQERQAAERASYVGLLASGLAHEIRNPLNAMNMNLQMLEEELQARQQLDDPDEAELLDSTKREIKRLDALVTDFLTYARPSKPRFEARDLNQFVAEILRFLDADFRQAGVELSQDLEPGLSQVEIDETQLKQALMNLLVNARQILRGGGTVTVRTRSEPGGGVRLEVEDDGPGISSEIQQRVFDVFYSNRGGGTGLGLSIARQIVERHRGTIELDSAEGHGATFRIRLPRKHLPEPLRGADPRIEGQA